MLFSASSVSSLLLVIGITGTAAKLGNYKIGDACAQADLPKYSRVAKLCQDLGPNGLDIGLDETIIMRNRASDMAGPSFSMREVLEAHDAEAALDAIHARDQKQSERKLFIDYGWCSSNIGFLTGGPDSSNYCNPSQECDSYVGCDSTLSSCCINHDKCLQGPGSGGTSRCAEVNCKGATCDKRLSSCAWGVSCCSRGSGVRVSSGSLSGWSSCDYTCVTASSAISAGFGIGESLSPQSSYNTGGDDSDAICSA